MHLIALISVRNPRLRGVLDKFHKDIYSRVSDIIISNRKIYETQIKKTKRDDAPVKETVSFEDAREFYQSGNYKLVVNQTHLIKSKLQMLDSVVKCLEQRNWCFVSAPADTQFICSDHPVVLTWSREELQNALYPPRH